MHTSSFIAPATVKPADMPTADYYGIERLGAFQYAVKDRRTGRLGHVWRCEAEARTDMHRLTLRNMMAH